MHWRISRRGVISNGLVLVWFFVLYGKFQVGAGNWPMNSDAGRQECNDFRPHQHAT